MPPRRTGGRLTRKCRQIERRAGPAAAGHADRRLGRDDRGRLDSACCQAGAARRARWDSATDRTRRSGGPVAGGGGAAARAAAWRWIGAAGRRARHAAAAPVGCGHRTAGRRRSCFSSCWLRYCSCSIVPVSWRICASSRSMRTTCSEVGPSDLAWPVDCWRRPLAEHAADRRQRRIVLLGRGGSSQRKGRQPRPLP